MLGSEWAMKQWQDAVERGDKAAAKNYQELYKFWKRREGRSCSE